MLLTIQIVRLGVPSFVARSVARPLKGDSQSIGAPKENTKEKSKETILSNHS